MPDIWTSTGLILGILTFLFGIFFTIYLNILQQTNTQNYQTLIERAQGNSELTVSDAAHLRVKSFLNWADRFFMQTPKESVLIPNFWTAKSLDRCLFLAVIYPILSVTLGWLIFGEAGQLGEALSFQTSDSKMFRVYLAASLMIAFFFFWKTFSSTGLKHFVYFFNGAGVLYLAIYKLPQFFENETVPLAVAGSVLVAFAFTSVGAGLGFGAVIGAFTFAGAFAGTGAVASAFIASAIIIASAVLIIGARAISNKSQWLKNVLTITIIVYFVVCFILPGSGFFVEPENDWLPIVLGLTLIPLLNVFFDWFSIGWTRKCLRKGLEAKKALGKLKWAGLDLGFALLSMTALCAVMIFFLEAFNAAARYGGHSYIPAPVAQQIHAISKTPYDPAHFWIYFALFTTLLPTAIHAFIWVFSLCGLPFRSHPKTRILFTEDYLNQGGGSQAVAAAFLSAQWIAAIVMFAVLTYIVGWVIIPNLPFIGAGFLWLMETTQIFSADLFSSIEAPARDG